MRLAAASGIPDFNLGVELDDGAHRTRITTPDDRTRRPRPFARPAGIKRSHLTQ